MVFLEVSKIAYGTQEQLVLDGITFNQRRLEKLAVAGETGSGKSTLLKIIAGLVQPDSGKVFFQGTHVEGPLEKLVPGHPRIAYLSQHFELPKFLRVEQVLSYSNNLSEPESQNLYEICQIDHLLRRKTDQLSGGERQRIALARKLIGCPSLMLLDEPYSNLDIVHRNTLKEVIADLSAKLDISLVLVSHDPEDTLSWADTIIVMQNGTIRQKGTPREIYDHPVDEYCAGLFGKYNLIDENLGNLRTLKAADNFQIIRPEKLRVSNGGNGIPVTIRSVRFFGAYYELEVECEQRRYLIHTLSSTFQSGQSAWLISAD
jgi:ABC-type sulfate/molybdate transport systems ATPase subunit